MRLPRGSRLLLVQAHRRRRRKQMRMAERQIRPVLANRSSPLARPDQTSKGAGGDDEDAEAEYSGARARGGRVTYPATDSSCRLSRWRKCLGLFVARGAA